MDFHVHKADGGYIIDWGKSQPFQVVTSFEALVAVMRQKCQPDIPRWMGSVAMDLEYKECQESH